VTVSIPFLDFAASVRELRPELEQAITRVLDSGHFILGPEGEALEKELAADFEVPAAVAVGNGTEAIQLALEALGVGPGDEVVTTPLTAAFTGLAIRRTGARPVFVEVDEATLNISASAAREAITDRTRALVPVHLYGRPAELEALAALARERDLALVEDACQAHGARYRGRPVGSFGAAAALSFYPTKNLGALGDGGAILVGDPGLEAPLRRLRNGGQSDRYRHEEVGLNSRLDEIQAALLRVKRRHLPEWTRRRRELAGLYREALADLPLTLPGDDAGAVYHLFPIRHPARDEIQERLRADGVGTLIHYPIPLHLQPAFADLGGGPGDLPVAERAARELLSLPLYPELSDDRARLVAEAVRRAVTAVS
jgi:dTDP-4-amino-4,6-dideoxygalactose transaminase